MQSPYVLLAGLVAAGIASAAATAAGDEHADQQWDETRFLANVRQLTFEGRRSGEGYFSPDGSKLIFQSEREPGNPFFQIYLLDLETGDTRRISPGIGKTTCSWVHPDGKRALFASTHEDPQARQKQRQELEDRAAGRQKRYSWDYDEYYDIYEATLDGQIVRNLTHARGYNAEGSYSPDGKLIAFSSNRQAYTSQLSPDDAKRLETDPSYFLEIYLMNADGSNVRRLTNVHGYDGGPFFSPEGEKICWRRFSPDGMKAEVWTMDIDGGDQRQITHMDAMSWAPFYYPSGDYLIFTTNKHGFDNFELYMVDADGEHNPVRVTYTPKFDGLPAFSPDGTKLAWTTNRTADGMSQIYIGQWDDAAARHALGLDHPADADKSRAPAVAGRTDAEIRGPDIRHYAATFESALRSSGDAAGEFDKLSAAMEAELRGIGYEPFIADPQRAASDSPIYFVARPGAETGSGGRAPLLLAVVVNGPDAAVAAACLIEITQYLSSLTVRSDKPTTRDVLVAAVLGAGKATAYQDVVQAILNHQGLEQKPCAVIELAGVSTSATTVTIHGAGTSSVWHRLIERRNVPVGLKLVTKSVPSIESLGVAVYDRDIPVLTFAEDAADHGAATESNKTDSTADLATVEKLCKLAALISQSVVRTADDPDFTEIKSREDATTGRPYLGTEPEYVFKGSGVLLKGVAAGGPAEAAGVRGGDIIVELDGKAIKDVRAYADALDELKPGQSISIVVLRDDKRAALTVVVGARR